MNSRTLLVTSALVFAVSGVARAAELSTAPMRADGSNYVFCSIVNVSAASQTVRIRTYDLNGTVTGDTLDFVLPARAAHSVGGFAAGHCRFTTVNAKTLFRASIGVWDVANQVQTASSPAQ